MNTRLNAERLTHGFDAMSEAEYRQMEQDSHAQATDALGWSDPSEEWPPEQCQRCGDPLKHGGGEGQHSC